METKRRTSIMSLRRGSRNKAPVVAPAKKSSKKAYGCCHGETLSGLKYALAWTVYVLLGSWLFLVLERRWEERLVERQEWRWYRDLVQTTTDVSERLLELQSTLYSLCGAPLLETFSQVGSSISEALGNTTTSGHLAAVAENCNASLYAVTMVTVESPWSFVDAIYYTMTHVTTIGYGHIYPTTPVGRMFAVVYAMFGVPLTCILMAKNSELLSRKLLSLYKKLKRKYRHQSTTNSKRLLYILTWLYMVFGFVVFMFLPSVGFVYLEGWSYTSALYYTFITLTTIGFGEFVGGYSDRTTNTPYGDLYKMAIVLWIMLALGYWVLLLSFLQKALKKKIVPKRIKVQFKSLQIARQAEFLRQLMTKVREQSKADPGTAPHTTPADPRVMSLMAEVTGTLNDVSRPSSIKKISVREHHDTAAIQSSDNTSSLQGQTLQDLLLAEVVLRTPKAKFFTSLISQNPTDFICKKEDISPPDDSEEVTLPLKDVLNLVTLVASLECQAQEDNPTDDLSLHSTIHSMVSLDSRFPKLRAHFKNLNEQKNRSEGKSYIPVSSDSGQSGNPNRRTEKRHSVLDAFLDDQTKREFIEVGEEENESRGDYSIDDSELNESTIVTEELHIQEEDESDTSNDESSKVFDYDSCDENRELKKVRSNGAGDLDIC